MRVKSDTMSSQWLIPRVDRPKGLDLAQALKDGVLTPKDYVETVSGCRICGDPAACARWIEDMQTSGQATELTAAVCRNAALVAELRAL